MICQFCFRDGRVFFRNRFVRTAGFVEEQAKERLIYKGAFATGNPSGGWFYNPFDFTVKNVVGASRWAHVPVPMRSIGCMHNVSGPLNRSTCSVPLKIGP